MIILVRISRHHHVHKHNNNLREFISKRLMENDETIVDHSL